MLALVLLPSWGMFLSGGPDQRWAYDLLVEPAAHGSTDLEDYGCYGTAVVAPVSARRAHGLRRRSGPLAGPDKQ